MDCVIGLGANLGDPLRTFTWTVERLGALGVLTSLSNLYENPAVGGPPQPDYLNGAVRLSTELDPASLLVELQRLEQLAGRERTVPWGPRTLDLDLLWVSGQSIDTERLTVPHPRLTERVFALKPLVEVAPKARCPLTQLSYVSFLEPLDLSCLVLFATASGPTWRLLKQTPRVRGKNAAPHTPPPSLR